MYNHRVGFRIESPVEISLRSLASSDRTTARIVRQIVRAFRSFTLPLPRPVLPALRAAFLVLRSSYFFVFRVFVCEPIFKSFCRQYGKGVRTDVYVHFVSGRGDIVLGDDVLVDGKCDFIFAARFAARPVLRVGSHVGIGHACKFVVGREISIGDHCLIASGVLLFDSSGHPPDPAARLAGKAANSEEVRPIVIGSNVWIGARSVVCPGVTIGEGSVVSAASVVSTDVPPYTVVAGNPARRVASLPAPQGTTAASRARA